MNQLDPENMMRQLGVSNPSQFIDALLDASPELSANINPRRVPRPNGYPDPRIGALTLVTTIDAISRDLGMPQRSQASRVLLQYSYVAAEFEFPVLFLSDELAQAFEHTDIEDSMDLREFNWPFPAFTLVIPEKQGIQTPEGGVSVLMYAKPEHKVYDPPRSRVFRGYPRLNLDNEKGIVIGGVASTIPFTSYASIVDPVVKAMSEWQEPAIFDQVVEAEVDVRLESVPNPKLNTEIHALNRKAAKFLGLTLLYLQSTERSGITGGAITRKASKKGDRILSALYEPKWIGREYRIPRREGSEGSHASPIAHVRRGHTKKQPYGPQNTLRKQIWIQPTMVGA